MSIDGHLIDDVVAALRATDVQSRCILLCGEARSGKSHLLEHLASSARVRSYLHDQQRSLLRVTSVTDLAVRPDGTPGLVLVDNAEMVATSLEAMGQSGGFRRVLRNFYDARCLVVLAVRSTAVPREIAEVWKIPVVVSIPRVEGQRADGADHTNRGVGWGAFSLEAIIGPPTEEDDGPATTGELERVRCGLNAGDALAVAERFGIRSELDSAVRHGRDSCRVRAPGGRVASSMNHSTGLLVTGGTGTGKSLLVWLLSSCLSVPVLCVHTPKLFGMFLGETEERLRRIFATARAQRPCILVLEGIEHIGKTREGTASDSSTTLNRRVLAALLCEMDGIDDNAGLLLIATSSSEQGLDPALLRQGRLETTISLSSLHSMQDASRVIGANFPLLDTAALARVARNFVGLPPAFVARTVRQLAIDGGSSSSESDIAAALKRAIGG